MLFGHLLDNLFMLFLSLGQLLDLFVRGFRLLLVLFLQGFQLFREFLIFLVGVLNLFLELAFHFFYQGGTGAVALLDDPVSEVSEIGTQRMGDGYGFISDILYEELLAFMTCTIHPCGVHIHQGFKQFYLVQCFETGTASSDNGNNIEVHGIELLQPLAESLGLGERLPVLCEVDMGAGCLYALLKVFIGDAGLRIHQCHIRAFVLV